MAEEQKHVRFAELLRLALNTKIKKKFASGQTLDHVMLREIRDCVRDTVTEIFSKSKHPISEQAMHWVANQYFKSIQLGTTDGTKTMGDLIVINDHNLGDMSFTDIQLMKNLFNETDMSIALNEEYRRRSAS